MTFMFRKAAAERGKGSSDLVPYWVFQDGDARVERIVPMLPFSREEQQYRRLKRDLALYRLVFGQPRQEDLLSYLSDNLEPDQIERAATEWRIDLSPPGVSKRRM